MLENYLEKVYSGIIGMNIGIRLGAPVEPTIWTYERNLGFFLLLCTAFRNLW